MRIHHVVLLISAALAACGKVSPIAPDYIDGKHAKVLGEWLASQSGVRVAVDEDCGCNESLALMRDGGEPNYHPYYRRGDFNGDGQEDLAAILLGPSGERRLAVFNGPFAVGTGPAFLGVAHGALFLNSSNPGPSRLLVGEFHSAGAVLKPSGPAYEL